MIKKLSVLFFFIVASFASGQDENETSIDFELLKVPYDFKSVNVFQVSSFKNLTNALSEKQYIDLFQELAQDRLAGDGEHVIPGKPHTTEYLLTKHRISDQYDFITVLKESEDARRINWLSYHSKDSVFELYGDTIKFFKGSLTNHGILSEEYENDSITYRSYSTFKEQDKIIKTTVIRNNNDLKLDSSITYIELLLHPFNDGFMGRAVGEQHYENGVLLDEIWESDIEWTNHKK